MNLRGASAAFAPFVVEESSLTLASMWNMQKGLAGHGQCAADIAPIDSPTTPRALWPVAETAGSMLSAAKALACLRKLWP